MASTSPADGVGSTPEAVSPAVDAADRRARALGVAWARAAGTCDAARPPHAGLLGLRVATAGDGTVELRWRPSAATVNPLGAVHGGFVATALDDAAALAAAVDASGFQAMLTASLHCDYVRPVLRDDEYTVRGAVLHRSRSRTLAASRLLDGAGQLAAHATGTFVASRAADAMRLPPLTDGAPRSDR